MKLVNSLKKIILEVASRDQVVSAIRNKEIIEIYYLGDEDGGVGYRTIEPVCLGEKLKKNGSTSTLLRAWDIEGASHTAKTGEQPLPGWRLFNINKISSWNRTGKNFTELRPGYNLTDDNTMTRVIINSKF